MFWGKYFRTFLASLHLYFILYPSNADAGISYNLSLEDSLIIYVFLLISASLTEQNRIAQN